MSDKSNPVRRRSVLRGIATTSALSGVATTVATADGRGAGRPTGREIERALLVTADHMTFHEDNTLSVDDVRARSDGVSPRRVRTATKFETMHNLLIDSLGSAESPSQSDRYRGLQSWFEPYFQLVASGKATKRVQPGTAESGSALNRDVGTAVDGGCGGTTRDPHDCPPYVPTADGPWGTKSAVQDVLVGKGFHETEEYVNQYDGDGTSYTKWVSAYDCLPGSFRTHGIIFQVESGWLYKTQTPEPNPEVYDYLWPTAEWPNYVYWWHTEFC